MSYEQQINEALARAYCTPENSSKELDAVLINAMTQEVLKSVGLIPKEESHPVDQQVSRGVGGQCGAEMNIVKDIATIINRHSRENASNTPDFILAEYLERCLITFEMASNAREKWYGKKLSIGGTDSQLSG
jgi:hypothetical protein